MENNVCEFTPQEKKQLCIGEYDRTVIASSCKWARFLAIVGFVMMGLGLLIFLMMLLGFAVAGMTIPGMTDPSMVTAMTIAMVMATLILLVYFIPLFYLYRYASKGLKAVETDDGAAMTESLLNLKRCFKFLGIFTIVVFALYVIVFIVSFMSGFTGAMSGMPRI